MMAEQTTDKMSSREENILDEFNVGPAPQGQPLELLYQDESGAYSTLDGCDRRNGGWYYQEIELAELIVIGWRWSPWPFF